MVLAVLASAGFIAAVFAVLMIFQRSLYASAICLLAVLLQISVLFFAFGAPLLAFLQVMIYAGAVMVLVVITIMAAPSRPHDVWSQAAMPRWLAALGVIAPIAEVLAVASAGTGPAVPVAAAVSLQPSVASVLFGPYALATEAVTLLMLLAGLAMVGEAKR